MSIAIVNVVVPVAGDGPIASIADLVGEKTVELSGRFVGRYVLLGSHNDINFVPVLIFDANGEESIKLSLPLALKSVRVRTNASSPVAVTMNVSGVFGPGRNKFATVASLPPGTSGVTAPIDLFTLFPPTGVESDINFLCEGGFDGLINTEGSMNGTNFNAIGDGFRTDTQPTVLFGPVPVLEFSPLKTSDLVRYLRLVMEGSVLTPTVVTFGGSIPTTSIAPAPKLLEITEEEGRVAVGVTEVILEEWAIDLSDLPIGPNVSLQLSAVIQVIGGAQATFNVYLGSTTPGDTTGGTVQASTNTVAGTEELVTVTSIPFGNPGGLCLVQVTGFGSAGGVQACIRSLSINIG